MFGILSFFNLIGTIKKNFSLLKCRWADANLNECGGKILIKNQKSKSMIEKRPFFLDS
jgi:hypothetical protein